MTSQHQDMSKGDELLDLSNESLGENVQSLKMIFTKCKSGPCPTVYEDETGDFVVQGFKLSEEQKSGIDVPGHEDVVKLPREFIEEFVNSFRQD